MKIVEPSVEVTFFNAENGMTPEQCIERAARTCYKSEDKIIEDSSERLIRTLKKRGHEAMLEFGYATAFIIADRGLTHELVRHRLCSFAQESTRYCNYGKGKFGEEITVIRQPGLSAAQQQVWEGAMKRAEAYYMELLGMGVTPQIARSVLPIGLKTEITIGCNLREWRHIFKMRCAKDAHPIIRGVMLVVLERFYEKMPVLYEDQAGQFLNS